MLAPFFFGDDAKDPSDTQFKYLYPTTCLGTQISLEALAIWYGDLGGYQNLLVRSQRFRLRLPTRRLLLHVSAAFDTRYACTMNYSSLVIGFVAIMSEL